MTRKKKAGLAKSTELSLSPEIQIPLEAVTQTFAILAVKGSGKSYTASVMAEEMLKCGQQVVVLDPTGAWWGLQSSADGKEEGFPIVVFGGDHGNVPLEENSGEIIAHAIVEQNFSAIIDLSLLRKGQANRFVGIFLETLYRINREPLHLFVDEADAFAPQKTFGDQARTLGAMEDIVRRGRKRGIGCTMITQRPAVINKDVLTQCEILIALRMSHPKDINAIMEWVRVHATQAEANVMIDSLPSMKTGNAWIWSPSWLKIFQRTTIRVRETFDSGATPKPGQRIISPKKLAQIDIKILGQKINETIERKKAEDPATLRKEIEKLTKQLHNTPVIATVSNELELREVRKELKEAQAVILNQQEKLQQVLLYFKANTEANNEFIITAMKKEGTVPMQKIHIHRGNVNPADDKSPIPQGEYKASVTVKRVPKFATETDNEKPLPKCEACILSALAQRGKETSKSQLGILSGYSSTSGSFGNALSNLRRLGLIDGRGGDNITITQKGMNNAEFVPLPAPGKELHQFWLSKLPKCERTILDFLIQQYPMFRTKHDIGIATKYAHTSGSFGNAVSKLRTLELVSGYANELKASDSLF